MCQRILLYYFIIKFLKLFMIKWKFTLLIYFYVSESNTMEYDMYYYMAHPPYSTYECMLRDAECWDDSIKEKYSQQP